MFPGYWNPPIFPPAPPLPPLSPLGLLVSASPSVPPAPPSADVPNADVVPPVDPTSPPSPIIIGYSVPAVRSLLLRVVQYPPPPPPASSAHIYFTPTVIPSFTIAATSGLLQQGKHLSLHLYLQLIFL